MDTVITREEAWELISRIPGGLWSLRWEDSVESSVRAILFIGVGFWIHRKAPRLRLPFAAAILIVYIRVFGAWGRLVLPIVGWTPTSTLGGVPGAILLVPVLLLLGRWTEWYPARGMVKALDLHVPPALSRSYVFIACIPAIGALPMLVRNIGLDQRPILAAVEQDIAFRGFVFLGALRVYGFGPALALSVIGSTMSDRANFNTYSYDDPLWWWSECLTDKVLPLGWAVTSCLLMRGQPRSLWVCVIGHLGLLMTHEGAYWRLDDPRGVVILAAGVAAVLLPWVFALRRGNRPSRPGPVSLVLAAVLLAGAAVRHVRIQESPYLYSKTPFGLTPDFGPPCHPERIREAIERWSRAGSTNQGVDILTCVELSATPVSSNANADRELTVAVVKLRPLDPTGEPAPSRANLLVLDKSTGALTVRLSASLPESSSHLAGDDFSLRALTSRFFDWPLIVLYRQQSYGPKSWEETSVHEMRWDLGTLTEAWSGGSRQSSGGGNFSSEEMEMDFLELHLGTRNGFRVTWRGEDHTASSTIWPGAEAATGEMSQVLTWSEAEQKFLVTGTKVTGNYGY